MDISTFSKEKQGLDAHALPLGKVYLLDREFRVLNGDKNCENGTTCAFFFDIYPANRVTREEIDAYLTSFPQECLLTLCGRTPVVFVGTLLVHTGLVLAVVPECEIAKTLSHPAAFHHVPSHIVVSASAQMRHKAHREDAFRAAAEWLSALRVFCFGAESLALDTLLTSRCNALASLLSVPISLDFSGLFTAPRTGAHPEFALGVVLAFLTLARREGVTSPTRLVGVMEGAPMLYLECECDAFDTRPPELLPLLLCAEARGVVFDVVIPDGAPCRLQARVCLTVAELSAQGVRERHRFLEGKSPLYALPCARALTPDFPELSLE